MRDILCAAREHFSPASSAIIGTILQQEMSSATLEAEKFLASRGAYVPKRKGLASKPDAYKFAVEKQPEGINLAGPRLAYHDYESQMQHKCVVLCAFFNRSLTTNGVTMMVAWVAGRMATRKA